MPSPRSNALADRLEKGAAALASLAGTLTDAQWQTRLPKDGRAVPFVSDFFDFSIYLDADEAVVRRWYIERFMRLRETAFRDPASYFHRYAAISDEEALATAEGLWNRINLVNLRENILPTRPRADLILRKGASHRIDLVALRRI